MVYTLTVSFEFFKSAKAGKLDKIKTISVVEHKNLLEIVQSQMTKGSIRAIRQGYLPLQRQLGTREFQGRKYGDKIPGN